MRLLVVSTWYPYPADNGSRLRAFFLIRELAKCFSLTLVAGLQDDYAGDREAVLRGEHPPELSGLCERVRAVPWVWFQPGGGAKERIRSLVDPVPRSVRETPNRAFVEAVNEELSRRPSALLGMELGVDHYLPDTPPGIPMVLDQVEVSGGEMAWRSQRGLTAFTTRLAYDKGVRYRRGRLNRYTALTAVSEEEAESVRGAVPGVPVVVVPNGVDVSAFPARDWSCEVPGRLIYNGAVTYPPNAEAVRWFAGEVLPGIREDTPEAELLVTGRSDTLEAREFAGISGVRLTGRLPDLRAALSEASIAVAPILSGGGTRLKILEAWAAGVPVVSTTLAATGLGAKDGEQLLLADTPPTFRERVVHLLRQRTERERLSMNGRRLVESRYDWARIGAHLVELIESRIGETRHESNI